MKIANVLIILLLTFASYGQRGALKKFMKLVDQAGMVFTMPEGFKVVDIKENRDLSYHFAIMNEEETTEVRYTIWPLDDFLKEYEESLKDTNRMMLEPNRLYKSMIMANAMNMTNGQLPEIESFPPSAVKKEFNADDGGTCVFEFDCQFGEGYKIGQFIYLHKDDVTDAIVTYMSNDINVHLKEMQKAFHSLKFKKVN
ncbi:MAG: hypothetical protein QNK23_07715 [Crocinitomicaceae bacterium]|nr:hypothetical protein [Crocinitomicaceae bacterium]